jgi:Zn ribbon nucleic-acid-binding protein
MDGARDDRVMYSRFVDLALLRQVDTGVSQGRKKLMAKQCTHLDEIRDVTPSANGCEDCLKIGDTWVHLRECLICGHVGCCDSSKNKHATKHFHATNHPIIQSFQPGEDWRWCYVDQVMF